MKYQEPITQKMLKKYLHLMLDGAPTYKKIGKVRARPAVPAESVVTVTSTGHETRNRAKAGDVVIENLTQAREQYIVDGSTFAQRYTVDGELSGEWGSAQPAGKVRALRITKEVLNLLNVEGRFRIEVAWGMQSAHEGDYLATPLPEMDEIYLIGSSEFGETYELSTPE